MMVLIIRRIRPRPLPKSATSPCQLLRFRRLIKTMVTTVPRPTKFSSPLPPTALFSSASLLGVITIGYESADAEVRQFNLFVHNSTFLRFLEEGKRRCRAERERVEAA